MNMEGSDTWDEEQIEAFMHERWLLMQEMGDDYYRLHENNDSEGEDEEQALRKRKTVAELIAEVGLSRAKQK